MRWVLFIPVLLFAACERPCNPGNCFGCCAGDECVSGLTAEACGARGETCEVCGGAAQCLSATCIEFPEPDGGGEDAGPGCACVDGCCLADGGCAPSNDRGACGLSRSWCAPCEEDARCEAGRCVSASCGGCFDPLGYCRSGDTDVACGAAGAVCQTCGADQACVAGACADTRCDADNCRFGCCLPDHRCVTSVSDDACGTNGGACVACTGATYCLSGSCQ